MIKLNTDIKKELFNKTLDEISNNLSYQIIEHKDLDKLNFSRKCGIVYLIYSNNCLKYIGKSKGKLFRERVKNHFIKQNKGTSSKIEFVKNEIRNKNIVTLKFVEFEPESLRNLIEEMLFDYFKDSKLWNYK